MATTNRTLTVLFLLCLGSSLFAEEDGFQPMFNGKDFSGWVRTNTPAETWSFKDDLLICSGKPIGEIRTQKMYENFIMELEWRHMIPKGNAGIFVWADDITSRGVPFHRGIEVQVLENAYGNNQSHTTHGDIFPIHGATMTPLNGRGGSRAFPTENRSNPSPEWNHYRIECVDGEISLAVNGKIVTRGKNCIPRKGYICLESEGGLVHYRNLRIQELPSTHVSADQVAIANRGYRSLYTGLNLEGWQAGSQSSNWQPKDWVLSYTGQEGQRGELSSTEEILHLGVVVDVKLKSETSQVAIQVGDRPAIDFNDKKFTSYLKKTGQWNRIEFIPGASRETVSINGHDVILPLSETAHRSQKQSLKLLPEGPVDFCNLYGRSTPVME